ncbi:MAG: HDOD domain-containing protein [Hahellaceae bacterium]|nr:HDOD domain-containing protein [Hahellaceae bacterium]
MSLEALFNETHNLPNIPKVVQELIENFNNPDVNADAISKKIQMDQVISAKVMRLANSARYGAGRKIASIDSAVVMLGFDTLKTLVVASGVTGSFKDAPGFDRKKFWRDSFMVASIAKLVGKHAKVDRETAFTCGMLHNIGEMLIHIAHTDKAVQIDKLVESGANRIDLEDNQFGYDYAQVGAELAKRWNFPQDIVLAIRQHANPTDYEPFSKLAGVVYISKYLNDAVNEQKDRENVLAEFPAPVAKPLGLDLVNFFEELIELTDAEDDIEELLRD